MDNIMMPPPVTVTGSKRFISAAIDYIVMIVISMIVSTPLMIVFFTSFGTIFPQGSDYSDPSVMFESFQEVMGTMMKYQMITLIVTYLYFLCKDIFGGRSIGKRSQNLQLVMKKDGGPVSYARMVLRNLTIIIWPVEIIMVLVNPKQRLGDMMCGTTVVYATEENRQPTDSGKIAVTILITLIGTALLSYFYYKFMMVFFGFYFDFLTEATRLSASL